jgi:N-acetylmuramoyl-L-alanine amidase
VLKSLAIAFVAALLLAGCASNPKVPEEVVTSPPVMAGGEASSLNWTETNVIRPFPTPRAYRPMTPAARTYPSYTAPVTTWTSLNRWAAAGKIGEPRLVSRAPVAAYAIGTANGTMVLDIGSRDATWNGVEVQLGFAPEFIDDQVFIHGLDLQKNLEPLLFGPPLTFGNRVIVVDPGHGGSNVGTHSVLDGRFEKEFTLDWALRLAPLLAAEGWQVFLTRTNDTDMSLSNRVAFAEAHRADVFISLHFNSTSDRSRETAGLETYCSTPAGMPSSLTRDYADTWSQSYPNNSFDAQNLQLAVLLHTVLLRESNEDDRGVRRVRFIGVLHGQRRPAVLIEGGYLSNPHEARLIESPEFRQKLAQAVADALRQ